MRTVHAIYKDGAFHPEEPVTLPTGARVEVAIPDSELLGKSRARFRNTIGAFTPAELDQMEADIEEAFGKAEPDDWK